MLVLFYIATVLTLKSRTTGVLAYVRNGVLALTGGLHASHPLALAFRPLLISMVLGILLGVVNSVFSTGDCIDFLTRMTTATVQAESTWQWLWVVLTCCTSVSTGLLLGCLLPCGIVATTKADRTLWVALTCGGQGSESKRAIKVWQAKAQDSRALSCYCVLLSWVLHIPVLCVAAIPATGYVSHVIGF